MSKILNSEDLFEFLEDTEWEMGDNYSEAYVINHKDDDYDLVTLNEEYIIESNYNGESIVDDEIIEELMSEFDLKYLPDEVHHLLGDVWKEDPADDRFVSFDLFRDGTAEVSIHLNKAILIHIVLPNKTFKVFESITNSLPILFKQNVENKEYVIDLFKKMEQNHFTSEDSVYDIYDYLIWEDMI